MLPGGADSIFEPADSLPLKLNQLPPVRLDFHEALEGGSAGEHLQIQRKDFRHALSKQRYDGFS